MAKKSISIVELHVEKVVLGVAVLFLLFVVFSYLISTPNVQEFDGKPYGPGQIDNEVRQRAETLAGRLQRTTAREADRIPTPNWVVRLNRAFDDGLIKANGLSPTVVAAVPWGVSVPQLKVERSRQSQSGGYALAKVQSPRRVKASFERIVAVRPADPNAAKTRSDNRQPAAEDIVEDINLVSLEVQFDVEAQRNELHAAYADDTAELVFADVQVQRRLVGEDGEGAWEEVELLDTDIPKPPVLELTTEGSLKLDSQNQFVAYRNALVASNAQSLLLAPAGPVRRAGSGRTDVVRETPAIPIDKEKQKIRLKKDDSDYRKPTDKDTEKEKLPQLKSREDAIKWVAQTLSAAEKAYSEEQYAQATKLARQVLQVNETTAHKGVCNKPQLDQIAKLLANAEKGGRGEPVGVGVRDEKVVSIRAFDQQGQPGRSYQYRLRVGILNSQCAAPERLKDPNDATRPVLYGDWSESSQAVAIDEDMYFYLIGEKPSSELARVDVFKWYLGKWLKASFDVAAGQEIGGKQNVVVDVTSGGTAYSDEVDFSTGMVAVDIGLKVPFERLAGEADGKYRLSDHVVSTTNLTYTDIDHRLMVRYAMVDTADRRFKEMNDRIKEREDKTKGATPGGVQPLRTKGQKPTILNRQNR